MGRHTMLIIYGGEKKRRNGKHFRISITRSHSCIQVSLGHYQRLLAHNESSMATLKDGPK